MVVLLEEGRAEERGHEDETAVPAEKVTETPVAPVAPVAPVGPGKVAVPLVLVRAKGALPVMASVPEMVVSKPSLVRVDVQVVLALAAGCNEVDATDDNDDDAVALLLPVSGAARLVLKPLGPPKGGAVPVGPAVQAAEPLPYQG